MTQKMVAFTLIIGLIAFILSVTHSMIYQFFIKPNQVMNGLYDTKIAAHRGASDLAPENTLAAIKKGLELGAGMIEFEGTSIITDKVEVANELVE